MKVVDVEPWKWRLLQDGEDLYLEAHCSHSAVDYLFAIQLDETELNHYELSGREYLDQLAHEIHYSAPGVLGSSSIYIKRRVPESIEKLIGEAV